MEIKICEFRTADAKQAFQAVQESLPGVARWLTDLRGITLSRIQNYIAAQPQARVEKRAYNFVIEGRNSNNFLGGCGLTLINWNHRYANIYYWVRASQTGQGIATQAVRNLALFGFSELCLQRLELVIAPENAPSLRVAEKAGARLEGLLRNRIQAYGEWYDANMYSLISTDLTG